MSKLTPNVLELKCLSGSNDLCPDNEIPKSIWTLGLTLLDELGLSGEV
jgi:hypothetical protein